jgi:hypothetical protein
MVGPPNLVKALSDPLAWKLRKWAKVVKPSSPVVKLGFSKLAESKIVNIHCHCILPYSAPNIER